MLRLIGVLGLCLFVFAPPVWAQPGADADRLLDELGGALAGLERPFDRYMTYHTQYHERLTGAAEGDAELGMLQRLLGWEIASEASAAFHMHAVASLDPAQPDQVDGALEFLLAAATMNEEATPPSREDLYKLGEAVDRLIAGGMSIGDLTGSDAGFLGRLLENALKVYKAMLSTDELLDEDTYPQRDRILRDYLDFVARDLSPILAGPAGAAFADALDWNGRLWDATSEGLGLVADAIERGALDMEAYEAVAARIERLAGAGPWDSETAAQFLKRWAESLPRIGKFLKAVWPDPVPEECRPINCDCDSVEFGLLTGEYRRECRATEAKLISQCTATRTIAGTCHPTASGPDAFP